MLCTGVFTVFDFHKVDTARETTRESVFGEATAGAVHALTCTCGLFPLVVTTRQQRAAASSSRSSVGGGCELAEACGMQLVLWRGGYVGCWWSGVGSDKGEPSIEQMHG
eukprot:1154557-Pelagomonas_calceolata.AAC.1